MMDLRFATALQLLLSLALAEEHGMAQLSSGALAEGLGVASSFVRKLIMPLARDGLIVSSMGKNGGVRLARPADQITVAEVYASVIEEKQLWQARDDIPHRCVVSNNIVPFFNGIAEDAGKAVMATLQRRTLRDSLDELRRLEADRKQPA